MINIAMQMIILGSIEYVNWPGDVENTRAQGFFLFICPERNIFHDQEISPLERFVINTFPSRTTCVEIFMKPPYDHSILTRDNIFYFIAPNNRDYPLLTYI